ncbi:small G protein signaling modulator 1-like isoform X2 [Antedon mediterranea]|uniref:small G protein signaling modulator 1-like isoform X2 n=1 Tax=Antedon mediterranea TaxID=105859 RepID=UPI003AF906B4
MANHTDESLRVELLRVVKKEVKKIMEEAVTRKFVHEDSGSIISLCAAVESCLSHGLKRRAVGLFKGNTSYTLLKSVAKNFAPASIVAQKVLDIEARMEVNNNNKKFLSFTDEVFDKNNLQERRAALQHRYMWIRIALFEKQLAKIVEYLCENCSKYYEKDALMSDPVQGPIVSSLLFGPCALDYSKMKTPDHYWTDPPADELVQRHRIHSGTTGSTSPRRPGLTSRKMTTSNSDNCVQMSAKDYVESLHQNSRATLLYGKNNVLVQPEDVEQTPGYLSLHQSADLLTIKWTPNQLMNGSTNSSDGEEADRSVYWDYAICVNLGDIVYLHCHQQPDCGGTLVLVGQDGVQFPPIHFPKGGHLLAFLSCLENGLLPRGQLDPPLWSQRGKGKIFPKLKRKTSKNNLGKDCVEDMPQISETEEATDYVFRIITALKPEFVPEEALDPKKTKGMMTLPWIQKEPASTIRHRLIRQPELYTYSPTSPTSTYLPGNVDSMHMLASHSRSSIRLLCDTMKKQIISRAFYGWIAHCRHLQTVRTHLSGLVNSVIIQSNGADCGLTFEKWRELNSSGMLLDSEEVMRLVYFGGVQHEIRSQVWPYLLEHYQYGWTEEQRDAADEDVRVTYEEIMSKWMAVEAIIKQRDKDNQLAKLSSENSSDYQIPLTGREPSLDSEVFEIEEVNEEIVDGSTLPIDDPQETERLREFAKKEDYVVIRCRRQETLETERGRSMSDFSDRGECGSIGSPHESDEGFGDMNTKSFDYSQKRMSKVREEEEEEEEEVPSKDSVIKVLMLGTSQQSQDGDHNDRLSKDNGDEIIDGEEEEGEIGLDIPGQLAVDCFVPASPASSVGGIYATELLDTFSLNLHRIDKDVQRCDRNYYYFNDGNLEKLRNIMCTYVWEHLDVGYVQGMCDLVAPLLVIMDDEAKTYNCFCELMKRMSKNFPHGGAMDTHFANMRSLIQVLDAEMFEHMHQNGDYTHFYFCYRWFLLDFKRELVYDDTFSTWETIWAGRAVSSNQFVLFIALALVKIYREIILDNNMDFTDIIKFFNEMAERHDAKAVLHIARDLVHQVQTLIENK